MMREKSAWTAPMKRVQTPVLDVEYAELGSRDGDAVVLLHGYPYDIHSFQEAAPLLAERGRRVLVPYLRGHGGTRALTSAGRSGQQAAIGQDVIDLIDALDIERAVFAGFDWGARGACVAAALHPERSAGVVSVNGYLIQELSVAVRPIAPMLEAGFWYFYYFCTERGRAGLTENRREIARVIWAHNSPRWNFTDNDLERAAAAFENPDYVDVVIHSYRHRLGLAPGYAEYAEAEAQLAGMPTIAVPAVTLDGSADGNFPATDGSGYSVHFVGPHAHHVVENAGHNLPQEAPRAFVAAVLDVDELAQR